VTKILSVRMSIPIPSYDHHHRITTDQEYVCANIPCLVSQHNVPKEEVFAFYKEHWNGCFEDPPDWFDEEFKARMPNNLMEAIEGKA